MTNELLFKFRNKVLEFYSNRGLCSILAALYYMHHFTTEEYHLLKRFIAENAPKRRWQGNCLYWFKPTNLISRIKWIDQQIKFL